jgi:ketosteroid isomerase-like protein
MADSELMQELECQRLVTRFFRALDAGDALATADLFTQDGVWRRQGSDVKGYDAIRAGVLERKSNVVVRHHVSNIDVHLVDADHAFGTSYYMLYRHEVAAGENAPFPTTGPIRTGGNVHRFVRSGGEWKIVFTEAKPLFAAKA